VRRPGLVRAAVTAFPIAVVGTVLFSAAFGPALVGTDPMEQTLLDRNQGPSAAYWLGTDHLGRDVLSRLVTGARLSLLTGTLGLLAALLFGGVLGLLAALLRGPVEVAYFGAIDLVRAMPGVLLALLLVVALGAGIGPVAIALGVTFAPFFAYVARATYARERAMTYVTAARTFGASERWILGWHVLPNIAGALVTLSAIILPRAIVTESVLSFLGLGVEPDTPTWGRMIAQSARYLERNPVAVLAPVLTLSLFTLSVTMLGDRLRARFDPRRAELSRREGT
jgi:ABC-type dipeptide/oligopeptide/nickel transport system permease subunit